MCNLVVLFAGTLPEGDGGRGHRGRAGGKPRSCDHRPRGQRDGDHPLEPDVSHPEEARVHVAPSAQDLGLPEDQSSPCRTLDLTKRVPKHLFYTWRGGAVKLPFGC